ncbi:MAG UNVERIFIED_CONTAM: hypothetical protein LVR18_12455 [Planctomycetaceae bacterium]
MSTALIAVSPRGCNTYRRYPRIDIPDQRTAGATDTAEATAFAVPRSQRLPRRAGPSQIVLCLDRQSPPGTCPTLLTRRPE